ncbi:thiopeptide-type bacteriocin biosynthesis protein [Streptacidiphilus sp. MAP12-33]|uniref:thiopeptide-type bacteriocin biosynthesis protein n=1 Tax=Streptacidiphilus sp. MAP12-33 TaxID=3156266 RepID=UPI0035156A17
MTPATWHQANITFPTWRDAEPTAARILAPLLRQAEDDGAINAWFVMRKHPCWRMRYQPGPGHHTRIEAALDSLTTAGLLTGWTPVHYEPETFAFGGPRAMDVAHRLFHLDTRNLFDDAATHGTAHRRETTLLLCSLLLRSAELDWYEQGDVWSRVAAHRPAPNAEHAQRLRESMHRLLTADGAQPLLPGDRLDQHTHRARAYTLAGNDLARLAATGELHRGLRAVLAHHILFAFNRAGLSMPDQSALTHAAAAAILGPDPTTEGSVHHAAAT